MPFAITDCRKASYYSDKLAKKSRKLPIVLTCEEVKLVLTCLSGVKRLMGSLLHGSGLRLMEFVRLRVKDIDFSYHQIIVRDGKGHQDRVTMLPRNLNELLRKHLGDVKELHENNQMVSQSFSFWLIFRQTTNFVGVKFQIFLDRLYE